MKPTHFLIATLICAGLAGAASIPAKINYQGVLKDASGAKVDGTVDIDLSLLPLGGGTAVFNESHTGVSVVGGLFSLKIGGINDMSAVPFDIAYELQLTVDGDLLSPNTPLCSAPYALGVVGGAGGVTAGTGLQKILNEMSIDPVTGALLVGAQTFTGEKTFDNMKLSGTTSSALVSNAEGKVVASAVSGTELGRLAGVTADVQSQFYDGSWKTSARVASNADVDPVTALVYGETIDGVELIAGDRVLLKDQSDASQNGIYVVHAVVFRALDMAATSSARGTIVAVEQGTAADTMWICTANKGSDVVDAHDLHFVEIGGGSANALNDLNDAIKIGTNLIVGNAPGAMEGAAYNNAALGITALTDVTTGHDNVAVGAGALGALTTANDNHIDAPNAEARY